MPIKLLLNSSFFSLIVFSAINPANAYTIFKCYDAQGKIVYSDSSIMCYKNARTVAYTTSSSTLTPTTTTSTTLSTPTTTTSTATTTTIAPTIKTTSTITPTVTAVTSAVVTDSIFKSTSFWYKQIPAQTTLHADSSKFVQEFLRQKSAYYNTVALNTYAYAAPVYIADSNVAPVKLTLNNCQNKSWVDPAFLSMMSAVTIPSFAKQSSGTDAEMVIYQPSTHTLWEMWKAIKDTSGGWSACWGGRILNTAESTGINAQNFGTTATGLPFIGGQITAEELTRGEIKHVMGIALVNAASYKIYSWPANRSDGYNPTNAPYRIPEGLRFRLDPTVNVDALPMSKAGKIIAKAAQKYGFVVWDVAGAISLRAQNALSYTAMGKPNPYPALYENKPTYAVLNGFPWDKLQFLPMNYGKPL